MVDTEMPVPHDIPLPFPAPPALLQIAIVVFFALHIVFVNLMLGGAILTYYFERLGLKRREAHYDTLARLIANTITVNKSVAVVLGVGPLLVMNALYSTYFYTANALTGAAWIAIIPAAMCAFLLLYWHKYSWERFQQRKRAHLLILAPAILLLLAIPLVFLTNINLMLFPEQWAKARGFFSVVLLPNVLPRYAHFLTASFAATGLFLAWYFGSRPRGDLGELTPPRLRRMFYRLTLVCSLGQFAIGPTVYFTLPHRGLTNGMTGVVLAGATCALAALLFLWGEINEPDERIGRGYWFVVSLFSATVACMVLGRHLYREESIREHRLAMVTKTMAFEAASTVAYHAYQEELAKFPPDQRLFAFRCGACHAVDTVRVGPPLREIATIYRDRPEGIVQWALAPGKKRPTFPQMPSMRHVGEKDLLTIARYVLRAGGNAVPPAPNAGTSESNK